MPTDDSYHLKAGVQPYDALNGMRVGAVVGGIPGAIAAAATGIWWLLLVGAVIGGSIGYLTERKRMHTSAGNGRSDPGGS